MIFLSSCPNNINKKNNKSTNALHDTINSQRNKWLTITRK